MTLPDVFQQGERFNLTRTFTAIEGVTSLTTVTATCTLADPTKALHAVSLAPVVIDNVAQPPTATFTGSFLVPTDNDIAGMWAERWVTSANLEDADEIYFVVLRSVVAAAL